MLTFEYYGMPLTWAKITPGNTITQVPEGLWKYTEYEIGYDSGDYAFLEGDVIIGATSGAVGIVISCTVVTGTVGGGDAAGKIRFHSWSGTNFTDDEKIKVAADTDVGDIDGSAPAACTDEYKFKGQKARSVIAQAHTQSQAIAYGYHAIKPDQTALYCNVLTAGQAMPILDAAAVQNLRVVDYAAGSAGFTTFVGYF